MAVSSEFHGVLIGYDNYTKEGKTTHTYYALVTQKQDKETGLFGACELVKIFEPETVIKSPKYGQTVKFSGEFTQGKNGGYMRYSNIELA